MRISEPRFPLPNDKTKDLTHRLYEAHREIARSVNGSAMWDSEGPSAPSVGSWAAGNCVRNSSPIEEGVGGSKYIIIGWICTAPGTPGTWLSMRVLTGN